MAAQENENEYDVILAGGGTAACVVAGRLAEADPSLSILIIEGGKNNLNDPTVTEPAIFLSHLAPTSQNAIFYKAEASDDLGGREAIVPCGGILGGGSSINFMMYTRAQGMDYDSWKTEGWDYKSLLPHLKGLETYHIDDPSIDKSLHGYDGPVQISRGTYAPKGPEDDILAAGEALGYSEIKDLQDFKACGGFSRWARYIGPDGKRQDAAHRYVHPKMASGKYPNLHLLVSTKVVRVLFDASHRASGVEVEPTSSTQPSISLSKPVTSVIKARKQVIVSAGALGTPSILERSGVGAAPLLEELSIPVIADLPGVGENYQDHHLLLYPYKTNLKPDETIDGLLSGRLDFVKAMQEKNPILGWNSVDICSKIRPSDPEIAVLGSDFQSIWEQDFAPYPERPLMLMGVVSSFLGDHASLPVPDAQYATIGTYTAYPYSRGSIHINSKSVSDPATFHTGFLSHPADLTAQVWAYKKQREVYRRTNAYRGELALGHPAFPEGSKAAIREGESKEGGFHSVAERKELQTIEYGEEDEKAIEDWIRKNVNTTWHSMGTCRMAAKDQGGVVDGDLNVYGTRGLKLADLSICPENVGANTNNTALVVGEKAASIIIKELRLGETNGKVSGNGHANGNSHANGTANGSVNGHAR